MPHSQHRITFGVSAMQVFNTRKMSPVFTPGGEPEVPSVFVDRFGAKAWTSHTGREGRDFWIHQLSQRQGTVWALLGS